VAADVEAQVVALKQAYLYWGPRKLRRLLDQEAVTVSTVARVLKRHGLVTPSATEVAPEVDRWERGEPNELWQMDLKAALRLPDGRKLYPVGILDDNSRFLVGLRLVPDQSDERILDCWIAAAREYGLPHQTLTDHGAQFGMNNQQSSAFRTYLTACGVDHIQGRVKHPQTQGKIERLWRTLKVEVLTRLDPSAPHTWQEALDAWRYQYNHVRPHESLGDHPPASRYQPSTRCLIEPDRHERIGRSDSLYRRVEQKGWMALGRYRWMIGRGYAGWTVEARPLGDGCWHVYFRNRFICEIRPEPTPRRDYQTVNKSVTHVPTHL
jgi:transposase InsO family protein